MSTPTSTGKAEPVSYDPNVREIGRLEDIDGVPVIIGVDYDAVTISGLRLDSAQAEEFARLFIAATWQAGQQSPAMAEDAEPEWDSGDSNAYQDRVEAGLEPVDDETPAPSAGERE